MVLDVVSLMQRKSVGRKERRIHRAGHSHVT